MYGVVIFTYGVFACNQYRGWYCIIDCWFGIAKVQKAIIQSIFYRRWIVCRNLRTYLRCFLFNRCVRHRACSKLTTKFQFVGVTKIKAFFEQIRKPSKKVSLNRQIVITLGIILLGSLLGVFQKWIDGTGSSILPMILQQLDIGNYFGRLAIWILLATIISVYSESPLRAATNTFFFFISMLAGYYLYCYYILGFLPRTYMMMWIVIAFASFFMAYICWYAKGEGIIAIFISSMIMGVLLAQAFNLNFTQGFYMYHFLEVITWLIGVILLRRKPKEYVSEIGLSVLIAFIYQLVMPHWG